MHAWNLFAGLQECQGQRQDGKGWCCGAGGLPHALHKQTNTTGLFPPLIPFPQPQSPRRLGRGSEAQACLPENEVTVGRGLIGRPV